MLIADNIEEIRKTIDEAARKSGRTGDDVLLLAVTKLHSPEEMNEAIAAGATDIGENKVQEILRKYDDVDPVRWHLIGHLQTNKVKQVIDKVVMIHSLDSMHLAEEIDKRAAAAGKVMDVLVQVNPAGEEQKFGVAPSEVDGLIRDVREHFGNVRIRGLMAVAPFFDDPEDTRPYFRMMKELFDSHSGDPGFDYLSMGMTNDYRVAVEEGSNLVRIGTAIFGARDYRQEEK